VSVASRISRQTTKQEISLGLAGYEPQTTDY